MNTWKVIYSVVLVVLAVALYIVFRPADSSSPAVKASVFWGVVALTLSLMFMLGAARSSTQFLIFFGSGAFGAGMGYLVGAWLTPTGGINPLEQMRNIVAGVLTGVVGTKLLVLWDDLMKPAIAGGPPRIMTAAYFLPVVLWFVGFTVSLSAFFTVRSAEAGEVRITYSPQANVHGLTGNQIGIMPEMQVSFASAANSPDDVTTIWEFRLAKPCGPPRNGKAFDKSKFQMQMESAFDLRTGVLTSPPLAVISEFLDSCPGSQDWVLKAISNQDHSKTGEFQVKFCSSTSDCELPAPQPAQVKQQKEK